jgi:hypothetical protein
MMRMPGSENESMINDKTFIEVVRRINNRRLQAVERWLKKCLQCVGLNPDEIFEECKTASWDTVMRLHGFALVERWELPISHLNDTEVHTFWVKRIGEPYEYQEGTTLKIQHILKDNKIKLVVSEHLLESPVQ